MVKKSAYSTEYYFTFQYNTVIKVETRTGEAINNVLNNNGVNWPEEVCETSDGEYVMVFMGKSTYSTDPAVSDYSFILVLDKDFNIVSNEISIQSDVPG